MPEYSGHLAKMAATIDSRPDNKERDAVRYALVLDKQSIAMADWLGRDITLEYLGEIHCSHCGRATKKSFSQGYCYPCFSRLAQCDSCMMSPEKCHFHLGTCREPEWAEKVCFNDHIVYLANSSGVKVGITRATQMPTRWLDQGAIQALPIARVANRKLSGLIEDCLRQDVADKTNWRAMLKGQVDVIDLAYERDRLFELFSLELNSLSAKHPGEIELLYEHQSFAFDYPVLQYPAKVSSHNLDKTPQVSGKLMGIKGQYLILDSGVINLRKFSSYAVKVTVSD